MPLFIEQYFDNTTMSVHIKEGMPVFAKRGKPGEWRLLEIQKKKITKEEIQTIEQEFLHTIETKKNAFIEIDKKYSKVLQIENFRIVIVKPPLSNAHEITIARPLKKLSLEDYAISEAMRERLEKGCEGLLVAGRPGEGKSTFAQALIEFYATKQKIIKTIEAPRDLQVPPSVTQYSLFHSSLTEIHDILLLSRPDYTIFDEVRNHEDFELFKDLRLTGIGMIGVIHGAKPIDSIQRFVGKIELGMISEIIDTLIFIEKGQIQKIYDIHLSVKVPHGMTDEDLARPVVIVADFQSGATEYEIYNFGGQTVVLPLGEKRDFRKQEKHAKYPMVKNYTKELFPKIVKDKKGIRFIFNETVTWAVIVFENGQEFELYPNKNGYVKIGKKGKLAELLRKKQFRVYEEQV